MQVVNHPGVGCYSSKNSDRLAPWEVTLASPVAWLRCLCQFVIPMGLAEVAIAGEPGRGDSNSTTGSLKGQSERGGT